MTRIVPLNKEIHKSLKVDARAAAAYGDNQRFTHVIAKEFPLLVVHYPILFAKDANTGEFYCGVMLGFDEGENLFLEEWRDLEFYRPLGLQRVPFYANGPDVAIDLDHPRVGVEDGTALFTEFGQPSRYLQRIIWAFQDLSSGYRGYALLHHQPAAVEAHRADLHRGGVRRWHDARLCRSVYREPGSLKRASR